MDEERSPACKPKRSKRGKGRKERMQRRIEKLTLEKEEHQQKSKELATKNLELRRLVYPSLLILGGR